MVDGEEEGRRKFLSLFAWAGLPNLAMIKHSPTPSVVTRPPTFTCMAPIRGPERIRGYSEANQTRRLAGEAPGEVQEQGS